MKTTNALDILRHEVIGNSEERNASIDRERSHLGIAIQIHAMRTAAGLTQQQLASKIGTTHSAISRLEDADYDGYSIRTLLRIAVACGKTMHVSFKENTSHRKDLTFPETYVERTARAESVYSGILSLERVCATA